MSLKTYRFICVSDFYQVIPSNNLSPDYLHIHILESSRLEPIEKLALSNFKKDHSDILYQWGNVFEKNTNTRSAKVSGKRIKQYGQVGIGSVARGSDEKNGDFISGGEGFLFGSQSFRITKGNAVFESCDDQEYWIFQVADFGNACKIFDLSERVVVGREDLMQILREKSGGQPFVATFDAVFRGKFFARSNGIFPEDIPSVKNPTKILFDHKIKGGHLVGGSRNKGDVESLKEKFSSKETESINFSCQIVSTVFLKPIKELKIAKKNGSFESSKPSGVTSMTQRKRPESKSKNGKNNNNRRRNRRLYNGYRIA